MSAKNVSGVKCSSIAAPPAETLSSELTLAVVWACNDASEGQHPNQVDRIHIGQAAGAPGRLSHSGSRHLGNSRSGRRAIFPVELLTISLSTGRLTA